ncbi:MAG: alpha/beta hydrolase fold domain-containing protein, partial [Clostridiales bacterium]|nr:alpha/beta hydrolase fold domain-containing protein [Clostridiales bacterium]
MLLAEKLLRAQLNIFKPFISGSSLEFVRQSQDKIGELMAASRHRDVTVEEDERENYSAAWIYPKDRLQNGAILYLHGGGYTCGTLDYAKGFGSVLCAECGIAVYCVGYRLAPENPFPAALDDAIDSYFRLISCGYSPEHIVICGESSGGGLAFSLCSKLKELGEKLPAGIIAISPWTDLTASGDSYEYNKEKDPSLDKKRLDYYADCYAKDRNDPYVSPIFADVSGFPPTLIFVGEDEILLDDSKAMYRKLLDCGVKSELVIAPELWHVYVLYGLKSRKNDMEKINAFLKNTMHSERKLRWMGLDNAGKIYPAARRRTWTNMYRVSATLCDRIDPDVLQSALDVTVRRFPSIAVRVRTGAFWYYLEEVAKAPKVEPDNCYPLTHFPFSYISRCAIRVLYYENRLAVELFHGLTDGSGAMVFLKALTAEYITQKYGENIPYEKGVLSRLDIPHEDELEDSFPKYSGDVAKSRSEKDAYHLPGT